MPKISVITATCRTDGIGMVAECLNKQTFTDFEWLIVCPFADRLKITDDRVRVIQDPPKRDGDFYRLNGAWNEAVRAATGELIVFAVDHIWFYPNALELFWNTYLEFPRACVSAFGHHYRKVIHGRPEVIWEYDRRAEEMARQMNELGYEWDGVSIMSGFMELSLASIPRQGILDVGGFDEEYDRHAGLSEKELCVRLARIGYQFFLANTIEHRIWEHPKESTPDEWTQAHGRACHLFEKHLNEVRKGTRISIGDTHVHPNAS